MVAIADKKTTKYRAFLSYSHSDAKWADRLHHSLETYRVPKHLIGQQTPRGPIPKRLTPIFRDRDELPSATDLGEIINQALADSACLIVICSPDSARSRWVNEEILAFKRLGGDDRIFSYVVGGEPNASIHPDQALEECFPEALRFKLGHDGILSDEPAEPIAADARQGKDGPDNARLKLISGMLGIGFDDLRQREQHRHFRRMAAITAASLVGMVIAAGLATLAWLARAEAVRQEARAEAEAETARQTTNFLVDLFRVSDPSASRGDEYTAHEILDKGAARIEQELAGQPAVQATLMDTLGTVYTGLGSVDRATPLLRNAVATRRLLRGNEHPEVAQSLNHLGQVLKLKAEYVEAEATFREALAIRRKILGNMHPSVAQSINDLADALTRNGDYQSAEPLFREALAMRRKLFGNRHADVAQSLEDLALNLYDQGNYEDPVPLLREAVNIRFEVQGDPHPDLAEALNNLGFVLGELGEHAEAEGLYRVSLAMKRKLFPEVHAEIAIGLNNVAFVLHDQGKYDEAEKMYRKALAMQRQVFGDDHTDVAMTLHNLAYLLYDKGDPPAAVEMSRESLATYRRVLGDNHPSVVRGEKNLALWLMEVGNYEEAEPLVRQSLAVQEHLLGNQHPDYAGNMVLLASVLVATGRYEEAFDVAAEARAIYAETLSEDHWRTMIAASAEGAALSGLGRYDEAEELLLKSHAILTSDQGALPVFITETTRRLASLYQSWGKPDKAARYVSLPDDGE